VLSKLPARNVATLTGKQFFPHLISGPFHHGLLIVFSAAIAMSVAGALVSLLRGKQFYYDAPEGAGQLPPVRSAATATVTSRHNGGRQAGPGTVARRHRSGPAKDRRQAAGQQRASSPADAES
jgi:hypothetical protein